MLSQKDDALVSLLGAQYGGAVAEPGSSDQLQQPVQKLMDSNTQKFGCTLQQHERGGMSSAQLHQQVNCQRDIRRLGQIASGHTALEACNFDHFEGGLANSCQQLGY